MTLVPIFLRFWLISPQSFLNRNSKHWNSEIDLYQLELFTARFQCNQAVELRFIMGTFWFWQIAMYIIVCILFRNFYKKEKINSQLLVQKTILLYFFFTYWFTAISRLVYLAWIVIYLLMLSLSSLSGMADFLIVQLDGQYTVFKFFQKVTFQLP